MSLKQCSGCEAMVEESKAFCPDCGMAVDEEQKRIRPSEYDSLVKTKPVSQTTQFKLAEHFKLSSAFAPPKKAVGESNEGRNKGKPVHLIVQPLIPIKRDTPKRLDTEVIQLGSEFNLIVDRDTSIESTLESDKKFYTVAGIISFSLSLALISAVILGILYWNYLK